MSFRTVVTPDDLKKGDLMSEPGWQPCEVSEYEEKPSAGDKSTNCIFTFKVIDGKDKGKTGNKLFNEKALGFGKTLWPVLGIPTTPEGGYELSTEVLERTVGKKLDVYFKRGTSNKNNDFNEPADFRPSK